MHWGDEAAETIDGDDHISKTRIFAIANLNFIDAIAPHSSFIADYSKP